MRLRRSLFVGLTAAAFCCIACISPLRADILFSGFENTFDTAVPGMPWHKDLTPDPPDITGPDVLETEFVMGGPEQGVTEGSWALQINHPLDWGTDEYYLILSDTSGPPDGEETLLDFTSRADAIEFDVTTFGADLPQYRQIFVIFNGSIVGWYDANDDVDAQNDYAVAMEGEPFHTSTVRMSLIPLDTDPNPEDQGDEWINMNAFADVVKADHLDGTPIPDFNWELFLVFQGADAVASATVRIVIDNLRFIGEDLTLPGQPGDYDGDGDVDGTDLLVWQRALGSNDPAADGDNSGMVDAGDLTVWRDNFGAPGASAAFGAVPEPSSVLMALAGLAALAAFRRARD